VNVHKNAKLTPAGRALLVDRVLKRGRPVRAVGREMGVSAKTVLKWVDRYEAEGEAGLVDRTSRPRRSPRRLARRMVRLIERLRRRRWTGRKIARALRLAVSTVSLWLRRLGLGRLKALEPKPEVVRYERERPGELLHLDTKKLGRIRGVGHRIHGDRTKRSRGVGWEYLHVCVDDASRVAYAEILEDEGAESATGFLERCVAFFAQLGVTTERVMTDNGSCYVSRRFRERVASLGARHLRTRPYRPQTNGKAERWIQTALREWAYKRPYASSDERYEALGPFLDKYNRLREHRSLGDSTPLAALQAQL